MKRFLPLSLAVASVCVVAGAVLLHHPVQSGQSVAETATTDQVVQPSGWVIHIDPASGKIVEPSPSAVPMSIEPKMGEALSTSSEGLTAVPSPVAGGGDQV